MSKVSQRVAAEHVYDVYIQQMKAKIEGSPTSEAYVNMLTIDRIEILVNKYLEVLDQNRKKASLDPDLFAAKVLDNWTDNFSTMMDKAVTFAQSISRQLPNLPAPSQRPATAVQPSRSGDPQYSAYRPHNPSRTLPPLSMWHHTPRLQSSDIVSVMDTYRELCPLRAVNISNRYVSASNPNNNRLIFQKLKALNYMP